jgi:hypothetical protein
MKTDIYFDDFEEHNIDWREELKDEVDPDDDEERPATQDVIDILGFDPDEESWD